MFNNEKTIPFSSTNSALQQGVDASKRWRDLSMSIIDHFTELHKNGQWSQLPVFERQWLTKLVESLGNRQ